MLGNEKRKNDAKARVLQIASQEAKVNEIEKQSEILERLKLSNQKLEEAASKNIAFSPPWLTMQDVPVIAKGTINLIQGKAGAHKSRLAESIAASLLGNRDVLGFKKYKAGGYCVAYVDTERNTIEDFPAAIQRIKRLSGYPNTEHLRNFYPVSIKQENRDDRLLAVKTWIDYVRKDMQERRVDDWNLLVILDVVTDCVRSFNNDTDALTLYDYIGNLCEDHGTAFLLLLHENPGTDKARGHVGTEALNKANTQVQIGYEKRQNGEDSTLIKLKFLKCRNAAKPSPTYFQFSKSENCLVHANPDEVKELLNEQMKAGKIEVTLEALERFFADGKTEAKHQDVITFICDEIGISDRTARIRLTEAIATKHPIIGTDGVAREIQVSSKRGTQTTYYLQPIQGSGGGGASPANDLPF